MARVVCPYCGYSWDSRSRRRLVTCPSCFRKVANPGWKGSGVSVSTSVSVGSVGVGRKPAKSIYDSIKVYVIDLPGEAYRDLRELAEEASGPDPSGVEVLVLDSGVAVEVLRHYGVEVVG